MSVYALIESDLTEAEAAGLPMTDASGLASQIAVKSLLAKVYLTMAGQPLNKGAAYYQKAADKAKEVIDYANANAPPPGVAGTGNSGLNYPLIRYAEVLLMYAEAQNEITGPNPDAYNGLKAIRDRANLVTPDIASFNQSTFRDAILKERWHEFSYEGITWFDMIRLRKVYDVGTNTLIDFAGAAMNGTTLQAKHTLLPLPAADFRNNPNLSPNNPGW